MSKLVRIAQLIDSQLEDENTRDALYVVILFAVFVLFMISMFVICDCLSERNKRRKYRGWATYRWLTDIHDKLVRTDIHYDYLIEQYEPLSDIVANRFRQCKERQALITKLARDNQSALNSIFKGNIKLA